VLKNFKIIFIVIACLGTGGYSLIAQESPKTLNGQILSSKDSIPIPFVNIYEENYQNFTSSSASGKFSMRISDGDTLNFSAVGFRPMKMIIFLVSNFEQIFYLDPVTYELPGLTIYGRNPMEGFYDHDRLYNPQTEQTFDQKLPKPQLSLTPGGAGVTGLLTLLANQFNSEYQQLRKLRKVEKDEYKYFRRLELIYTRLTPEYITGNTSLEREEVEGFLDFWKPSVEFLEIANEYEILTAVQQQELNYIRQMRKDNKGKDVVSTIELRKLLDNYRGNE